MKSFAALLAVFVLAASTSARKQAHVEIHRKSTSEHHVEGHVANQEALTKKQEMLDSIVHMKATPWDSKPDERATKCKDLCLLQNFWEFQRGRNCLTSPTGVCALYKSGLASMDVVLTVAECTCGNSTSSN